VDDLKRALDASPLEKKGKCAAPALWNFRTKVNYRTAREIPQTFETRGIQQ